MADIREQSPVGKKASAGGKGHNGAALATVFIQEAETSAREQVRVAESMKSKLKKLQKLSAEDHTEFRATMNEKREAIKSEGAAAGHKSLQEYFDKGGKNGQIARIVQVSVSMWVKMDVAMAAGWEPDYVQPWAVLSKQATDYKAAQASGTDGNKGAGRPEMPILDKAKNFVKGNILNADGKVKPELLERREEKEGGTVPLVDSILMMVSMADTPDEIIDELVAKLGEFKTNRAKAREDAAKAAAKASASSKAGKMTPEKRATLERSAKGAVGEDLSERAQAIVNEGTGKATAKNKRRTAKA